MKQPVFDSGSFQIYLDESLRPTFWFGEEYTFSTRDLFDLVAFIDAYRVWSDEEELRFQARTVVDAFKQKRRFQP